MAKLIIDISNPKKANGKIEGAVFAYCKLQSGDFKYKSNTEKEYSVDIVVDKATAKAFKKAFPKNSVREVETKEFEDKYKFAPPYPKEEDQYIVKLKSNAQLSGDAPDAGLSKGDLVPYEWSTRPKVFVPISGGVKDVTLTTLVGNGSKGDAAFKININDYGNFPQLTGILVEDLVEYEQNGSASAFGAVVGGLNADTSNIQQVPTERPEEPEEDEEDGEEDDDVPF